MVKLHCNCLNISIEAQGGDLKELNGASFLTNSSSDEFFKGKIFEIHLAVGGIQKEQEILMRERHIEDWLVFKCLGCNTEPFALHSIKREDRVLVNGNIQNDNKKIEVLMKSENMSPAFKILLQPATEDDDSSVSGFSSESIAVAAMKIQENVKTFLKSEEEAMLERIRKYTEEQRKLYAAVQSRAHNDKRALLNILRRAAETKVQESLSDAMADLEFETDVPDERPLHRTDFVDSSKDVRIFPTSQTMWNTKDKPNEVDNDHLDPLFHSTNEDFQPFVESDEEESSDNSFNQTDMEYEKTSSKTKYSSSVPVSVPLMNRSRGEFRKRLLQDDKVEKMPSPDKIAESIQALARSVHDSRDIFGELPRPRKNTLPITFN